MVQYSLIRRYCVDSGARCSRLVTVRGSFDNAEPIASRNIQIAVRLQQDPAFQNRRRVLLEKHQADPAVQVQRRVIRRKEIAGP